MQNEASFLSDRVAPPELWRIARAFLHTLLSLFDAPETIARMSMVTGSHRRLASWMRCGEALLRRLLMIEAAAYPKRTSHPMLRAPRKRMSVFPHVQAAKPEEWRVSFRCFTPTQRAPRKRGPTKKIRLSREEHWLEMLQPPKLHSARALAERFEALIRVFNDPAAYAKRLAARLRAKPERIRNAMRAPSEAVNRIDRFNLTGACAEDAWPMHFSSA